MKFVVENTPPVAPESALRCRLEVRETGSLALIANNGDADQTLFLIGKDGLARLPSHISDYLGLKLDKDHRLSIS